MIQSLVAGRVPWIARRSHVARGAVSQPVPPVTGDLAARPDAAFFGLS